MIFKKELITTLIVRRLCLLMDVKNVPVILLINLIGINNASIWKANIDSL